VYVAGCTRLGSVRVEGVRVCTWSESQGEGQGALVDWYVCVRCRRHRFRVSARLRGTSVYVVGVTGKGSGRVEEVRVCTWSESQGEGQGALAGWYVCVFVSEGSGLGLVRVEEVRVCTWSESQG